MHAVSSIGILRSKTLAYKDTFRKERSGLVFLSGEPIKRKPAAENMHRNSGDE